MRSRRLLSRLAVLVICAGVAGCEEDSLAPPSTSSPDTQAIIVQGTERLGWDQQAANRSAASRLDYVAYVDGDRRALTEVRCGSSAGPNGYPCDAPLPSMTSGTHVLELATIESRRGRNVESPRSAPLRITLVGTQALARSASLASTPSAVDGDGPITWPGGTEGMAETMIANLSHPSAMAFGPDGRLFIGERSGRVLAFDGDGLLNATVLDDVVTTGDAGLLSITLHPDFANTRWVYVVDTAASRASRLAYRVSRFREVNGILGERAVLLDGVEATPTAAAAVSRFGPDGKLYVAFGRSDEDGTTSASSFPYNGSVLRLEEDGTTPRDNPTASPVYSFGHDTPRGFDWVPSTGGLWMVERVHGQHDALNRITRASHDDEGRGAGAVTATPVVTWPATLGVSGAAMYDRGPIQSLRGTLLVSALEGQDLVRVRFDATDPTRVASTERVLQGRFGRIASVEVGPEGAIYFLTANRGHDTATTEDDRLVRLVP